MNKNKNKNKSERKKFLKKSALIFDFNELYSNELIKKLLRTLYKKLNQSKEIKTKIFLSGWKKLFRLLESSYKELIQARRKELSKLFSIEVNENNEFQCIFVLHTTLSIIIKLLTYQFFAKTLNRLLKYNDEDIERLKRFYSDIEMGHYFRELGIINFCQNDFFSWYIWEEWDKEIYESLLSLKSKVSLYEFLKPEMEEGIFVDLLKSFYEDFIPREIRYSFGEYFTPQIIADYMVKKAKEYLKEKVHYKAIDPTCGLGTFIVALIKDKLKEVKKGNMKSSDILKEVIGIDLNPIAVIIAKFNYLLLIYPHLIKEGYNTDIEIPIYLGDASYCPTIEEIDNIPCLTYQCYLSGMKDFEEFPEIVFPVEFVKSDKFTKILFDIEHIVLREYHRKQNKEVITQKVYEKICEAIEKINKNLLTNKIREKIFQLIKIIVEYYEKNFNTICLFANYVKPFALRDSFDLIIGNPPWVRWSALPQNYREKIKKALRKKGIFSKDTNYGGIDLNICALITANVIEYMLKEKGILGFIFPKGILTNKSFEGFRNFVFGRKHLSPVLILKPKKPFFKGEEPIILFLN